MLSLRTKRRTLVAIAGCIFVMGLVGLCVFTDRAHRQHPFNYPLRFDADIWKRDNRAAFKDVTYDAIYSATRDRMAKDLILRVPLRGKTEPEIIELLGAPDYPPSEYWPGWDLIYWMGPDDRGPMGFLDFKYLVLKLDSEGKVSDFRIMED